MKCAIPEFLFIDDGVCYSSVYQVFSYFFWKCFVVLQDILFFDGIFLCGGSGFKSHFFMTRYLIVTWIIAQVFHECEHIALCETFFALILTRLGIEIEMSFIALGIFVTVIEKTVSDEFFSVFVVFDMFVIQIIFDSERLHNINKLELEFAGILDEGNQSVCLLIRLLVGNLLTIDSLIDSLVFLYIFCGHSYLWL